MDFAEAGTLIRQGRRQAGLTQGALAKQLRMSQATISQIENGIISELGIRKFAQVCDRVGLEIRIQPRNPKLTLHQTYERNRQERQAAFKETDAAISQLKH